MCVAAYVCRKKEEQATRTKKTRRHTHTLCMCVVTTVRRASLIFVAINGNCEAKTWNTIGKCIDKFLIGALEVKVIENNRNWLTIL